MDFLPELWDLESESLLHTVAAATRDDDATTALLGSDPERLGLMSDGFGASSNLDDDDEIVVHRIVGKVNEGDRALTIDLVIARRRSSVCVDQGE